MLVQWNHLEGLVFMYRRLVLQSKQLSNRHVNTSEEITICVCVCVFQRFGIDLLIFLKEVSSVHGCI